MNLRQLEVFYAIMQAGTVSGAARNALDCALWALEAQLADGQFPSPLFNIAPSIETAMTVSVAELSVMTEQAKEYVNQGATLLKVKLDDQAVVDKIAAIRTVAPIGTLFELYSHTN